jgi:streptogramin lyase
MLAIFLAGFCNYGQAQPKGGDILVVDFSAGTEGRGALFSVDKNTGMRTLISDFGQPIQGGLGTDPFGVVIEPSSGDILVVDYSSRLLFRVDPDTGNRTILSDFADFLQGPTGIWPVSVAIDSAGSIFIVDLKTRLVFRVDAATGNRTVISSFKDATQGPIGRFPFGVTIDQAGKLLVTDQVLGLFRVDPETGTRTLLSAFGDATQGPLGAVPNGIDNNASGKAVIADQAAGAGNAFNNIGVLFLVDPITGGRTVLTDFSIPEQGPLAHFPTGVAVDQFGKILTTSLDRAYSPDPASLPGLLMVVDPSTGIRTVLSDFGDPSQGPVGNDPFHVEIVPTTDAPTAAEAVTAAIEIKLGNNSNQINRRSNANILVALLSSTDFDAATVDRSTVTFANARPLDTGSGPQDTNRDGLPDVVFHFSTQQLDLPDGTSEACLKGSTSSGVAFEGCGPVLLKK